MRRRELDRHRARALVELIALALAEGGGAGMIRAGAREFDDPRLRLAAEEVAGAVEAGETLSGALALRISAPLVAAVRSGERQGDPSAGVERARCLAARLEARDASLRAPLALPLLASLVAMTLLGVGLATVVPAARQLRLEMESFETGRATARESGFRIADHPAAVAGGGLALSVLPLLAALLLPVAERRPRLGRLVLRLPFVGRAARLEIEGTFGEALASQLEANIPAEEAVAAAAGLLSNRDARERLLGSARRVGDGERLDEALLRAGIAPPLAGAFAPSSITADGSFPLATIEAEARSTDAGEAWKPIGRFLSAWGWAAAAAAAVGLLVGTMEPLFALGGAFR